MPLRCCCSLGYSVVRPPVYIPHRRHEDQEPARPWRRCACCARRSRLSSTSSSGWRQGQGSTSGAASGGVRAGAEVGGGEPGGCKHCRLLTRTGFVLSWHFACGVRAGAKVVKTGGSCGAIKWRCCAAALPWPRCSWCGSSLLLRCPQGAHLSRPARGADQPKPHASHPHYSSRSMFIPLQPASRALQVGKREIYNRANRPQADCLCRMQLIKPSVLQLAPCRWATTRL